MAVNHNNISKEKQSEYYEWVGRISVEFAFIELQIKIILAKLSNAKHKEIAYFFADRDSSVVRKFDTINALIKKEPHKSLFPDSLIHMFKTTYSTFLKLSKKRNSLLHNILILDIDNKTGHHLKQMELNWVALKFDVKKEYRLEDLQFIFMSFVDLGASLSKISNEVTKLVDLD